MAFEMVTGPSFRPHPTYPHRYVITYRLHGNPYSMIVSKRRGPVDITAVYGYQYPCNGEEGFVDAYEDIRRYLGPNHDFHGIDYTPRCLGYRSLAFYLSDDTECIFSEDDVIRIPPLSSTM